MKTARKASYRWHLRRLMAENDMYATTELGQVYRLVTGTPERLSLATLAALCDILGCGPGIWSSRSPVPPAPASRPRRRQPAPRPLRARSGPGSRAGHSVARCPAGHETASSRGCAPCRRDQVVEIAAAADGSLPRPVIGAAVDAVAPGGQALRHLVLALSADPGALAAGAPPVAGKLAAALIARGSAVLTVPACTACGRAGKPLFRGDAGSAVCQRCRSWQLAVACASCGKVRPRAGRDDAGQPACEACFRRDSPQRHRRTA